MKTKIFFMLGLMLASGTGNYAIAANDSPGTKFLNQFTIGNTRHNLTQRQTAGGGPNGSSMDQFRNDYQEVCVYCHTPHGANTTTTAPLWNRTIRSSTTYTLYNQANLTSTVTSPGANSLSCLSCHDGTTAVDSIVNMPGSGRANPNQMTTQNDAFLDTWTNGRGPDAVAHAGLSPTPADGCLACHSPGAGVVGAGAVDFTVFAIGTDLSNDHPVGVRLPTDPTNWNTPTGVKGSTVFFDKDANSLMTKDEIRLYNTGQGPEVECASCHDPHGVPSAGVGSKFNPTFLRIANTNSAVCLTCHNK